jgi:hypothetical protein
MLPDDFESLASRTLHVAIDGASGINIAAPRKAQKMP